MLSLLFLLPPTYEAQANYEGRYINDNNGNSIILESSKLYYTGYWNNGKIYVEKKVFVRNSDSNSFKLGKNECSISNNVITCNRDDGRVLKYHLTNSQKRNSEIDLKTANEARRKAELEAIKARDDANKAKKEAEDLKNKSLQVSETNNSSEILKLKNEAEEAKNKAAAESQRAEIAKAELERTKSEEASIKAKADLDIATAKAEAQRAREKAAQDQVAQATGDAAVIKKLQSDAEAAKTKAELEELKAKKLEEEATKAKLESEAAKKLVETLAQSNKIPSQGVLVAQNNISNVSNNNSTNVIINENNATEINQKIANFSAQINFLQSLLSEQTEIKSKLSGDESEPIEQTIKVIQDKIGSIKSVYSNYDQNFNSYLTSIKPNDKDLYLTSRKASEIYPKIPYYIPGTSETGEFWVEPVVSDRGQMTFNFKFVDMTSAVEKVRESISMNLSQVEDTQQALLKLHSWSKLAHEQKLRKNYEKRVTCFPASECPEDGQRIDGSSSTEIRFNVYEDGSTAGRIQRNKGMFVEGYNISIDSAMLLQAYLKHVINEAKVEFKSGTQDKKSLDALFK